MAVLVQISCMEGCTLRLAQKGQPFSYPELVEGYDLGTDLLFGRYYAALGPEGPALLDFPPGRRSPLDPRNILS
jgi:hypothetical protein